MNTREHNPAEIFVVFSTPLGLLAFIVIFIIGRRIDRKLQSKRPASVTRIPKTPINEKQLILYNGSQFSENKTPEAKILLSGPVVSKNKGSAKLNKILKMIFGLEELEENLVPTNTKIISIKMEGFKHGANCHDFEPIDRTISGSFFTFQIYGQSIIQVTRYVVGEQSFVAGFCIYNEFTESHNRNRKIEEVDININVIKKLMESPKYPGRDSLIQEIKKVAPATTRRLPAKFLNIRHCQELKRGIMTDDESDTVYHQEWNPTSKSMKTWKCNVCTGTVDSGEPPSYSLLSIV